jgi:hypothetical protein
VSKPNISSEFGLKRRQTHCFGGRTEPNEYGMVKSGYASNFPGIPYSEYGYKGTQPVYGGNTGVGGYPGLGSQTMKLLPRTRRIKKSDFGKR